MNIEAYHGSYSKPFKRFERRFCGSGTVSRGGFKGREQLAFFFTTSRENAAFFADVGGFIGRYRLRLANPIPLSAPDRFIRPNDWALLPKQLADMYQHDIRDRSPISRLSALIQFSYIINSSLDQPWDAVVAEDICDGREVSTVIAVLNDDEERANQVIELLSTAPY